MGAGRTLPLSILKWGVPLLWCVLGFCMQSILLHITTMNYISARHNFEVEYPAMAEKADVVVEPLQDVGHMLLGRKKIKISILDAISSSTTLCFICGCILIKDLHLWTKVFFSCGTMFMWKGALDYLTLLPDSTGWDSCLKRLHHEVVDRFVFLNDEYTAHKFSASLVYNWFKLEWFGITRLNGKVIWPVRYCSDMLVSGHTFVMFLFLLASLDLGRRLLCFVEGENTRLVIRGVAFTFAMALIATDLYLITINHFHYTVDVVLSCILTTLIYTNAGVAIFTDWLVTLGSDENYSKNNGVIWIPPIFFPFCCFHGYYDIYRQSEEEVFERQRASMGVIREETLRAMHSTQSAPGGYGAMRDPGAASRV